MHYLFLCLLFFVTNFTIAQEQKFFYYTHNLEQEFKLRSNSAMIYLPVHLDRNEIKYNTLFEIDSKTTQLKIPESGVYEISGFFNFNLNTGSVENSRSGINFGFIQNFNDIESFIASTRFSFNKETQSGFRKVEVYPTIIFLKKGTVLFPAITSGLLDKPIFGAKLGCDKSDKECITFEWKVVKIADENDI